VNWFDKKVLRVRERPAPVFGQIEPERSVKPPVKNDYDYDAGGSEKAKAFIKVWEHDINVWHYSITVIYKGQEDSFTTTRQDRLSFREQNWSQDSAKKNAESRAKIMAKRLRVKAEPKSAEYEVEL
jgi:hypothetical protein